MECNKKCCSMLTSLHKFYRRWFFLFPLCLRREIRTRISRFVQFFYRLSFTFVSWSFGQNNWPITRWLCDTNYRQIEWKYLQVDSILVFFFFPFRSFLRYFSSNLKINDVNASYNFICKLIAQFNCAHNCRWFL